MADQAQRLIFMFKKFQAGLKFTTAELLELAREEFGNISLRTIQRDMLILASAEPALSSQRAGKEHVWYIPRDARNMQALVRVDYNELLSFYILKAHLKTFAGTVIEEDVKRLEHKIEKYAPEDIYNEQSLFWDQNIGHFDYTQYDAQLRRVIMSISEKKWADIKYNSSGKGNVKEMKVLLRSLFSYGGALYVVAWEPKHENHIALAIQHIEELEMGEINKTELPVFDFREWTKNRFGVFFGDLKKVVIEIKKEYAQYFINRKWHQSQVFTMEDNGDVILEMKVPITPDFISWIISWHDAVLVLKPSELIFEVHRTLRKALDQYEGSLM